MKPGIYLDHKPVGVTSFTRVHALMREVEAAGLTRKQLPVCHGGTLDPFAEGLLLMLAGPATQLMDWLHAAPKTYEAEVVWGVETDTGDGLGQAVHTGDTTHLTAPALEAALQPFLGWTDQVPPATSAKKLGGEPAYKKAHRGETVVLPPSRVYLHEARWLAHDLPRTSRLRLVCRGGYYVRALARELGRALGCGAHLSRLHRTSIGPWADPGPTGERVGVHGPAVLPWCPTRAIAGDEVNHLKHGRGIPRGDVRPATWSPPEGYPDPAGPVLAVQRGRLVALLDDATETLRVRTHLWAGV
ncbi:tRNA pseudouridine(55) synthase TruB [Melittangium boletus]|uniref:tRNA pseudouridine(55) synthase TruB n=1 Tax=Melittangium boletus TaxID=83453 RepID=UPI003DA4123D